MFNDLYHDRVFKHLMNLKFNRMTTESDTNELKKNIRVYLIRPFAKAHFDENFKLIIFFLTVFFISVFLSKVFVTSTL